jgi:hypothetical protein
MPVKFDSNLPVPNSHVEPLYRQTYNSFGDVDTALVDLTQVNYNPTSANGQQAYNSRLNAKTNKGILGGSVVACAGEGQIGPAAGDSTTVYDKVVGIAVNDALGNPYESSSAVASNKIVYMHGSGTVLKTDIYETQLWNATGAGNTITYTYGDKMFASVHGLLTNASGLQNGAAALAGNANTTLVGILLQKPTSADPWMVVQLKI